MPFTPVIYIFTLIGLLLGLTLDLLIRNEVLTLFYYSFATLSCGLYVLAYDEKNVIRLIGTSLVMALFLSIPFIGIKLINTTQDYIRWFTFLAAFPLFAYIVHCFHYAFHHDNTWQVSYTSLFAAVWNTILLLFVASIFASLAHLLIMLAAFVFKTVGSTYLWDLYFNNHHFRLVCTVTLYFIGLGVGQQNVKIIYSMRFLLLKMMYFLFPFLALISIIYFILFMIHSVSTEANYIDPLIVLTPLCIIGIIFFNAYFQDGATDQNTPQGLKIFLRVYRVILFILVLILFFKILQETVVDMNSLIALILVLLFSLTYALTAVLPEQQEIHWIRIGNVMSAMFFVVALFLVNLPYIPVHYTVGTNKFTFSPHPNTPKVVKPAS